MIKKTKIALPEVKIGLLPGAGGTQRLPKLVGLTKSLDIMLTGKNIFSYPAKKIGLVDEVVDKSKLHMAAVKMIMKIHDKKFSRKKIKKNIIHRFLDHTVMGRNIVFKQATKKTLSLTKGNYPAPIAIIECVKTGFKKGYKAGFESEVILFEKLILSDVSKALRDLFFITTKKKKEPIQRNTKKLQLNCNNWSRIYGCRNHRSIN
jgi:3-hydroxyacyl-CoA dehydrogenase/enoyl-CoA hydratase/3-hydroxybutyryl-CoA epimerase